jgi:hypothetical protein
MPLGNDFFLLDMVLFSLAFAAFEDAMVNCSAVKERPHGLGNQLEFRTSVEDEQRYEVADNERTGSYQEGKGHRGSLGGLNSPSS